MKRYCSHSNYSNAPISRTEGWIPTFDLPENQQYKIVCQTMAGKDTKFQKALAEQSCNPSTVKLYAQ